MTEQKIIIGNSLNVLKTLPAESIDVCVTSPPYWGLRDYGSNTVAIWESKRERESCEHDWVEHTEPARGGCGNANVGANKDFVANNRGHPTITDFCSKCGAWRGQLGLEPNPLDYIEHLCMIFDEIKRILKPTGACWVNIGDTYNGNKKGNIDVNKNGKVSTDTFQKQSIAGLGSKSLIQIPSRFAIAMTDRGWILRNECIWHKPNVMPQSCKDRFTVDFEKFFFFTKEPTYYFKQQKEPIKDISLKRARYGFKSDKANMSSQQKMGVDVEVMGDRFANPEGRNCRTTWTISTSGERYTHIAMFPEALIERPIDACCPKGGVVLDPFAGSGTVLAYCKRKGIDAIGIDINSDNKVIMEDRVGRVEREVEIKSLDNF